MVDASQVLPSTVVQTILPQTIISQVKDREKEGTDRKVDSICEGGAVQVSNRFQAVPLAGQTTVSRSTFVRCGAPDRSNQQHNGALYVWPQQGPFKGGITVSPSPLHSLISVSLKIWRSTTLPLLVSLSAVREVMKSEE